MKGSKAAARRSPPSRPRLFSIPPTTDFLEALAGAILQGDLPVPGGGAPDAGRLSEMRILLPTRRACRALRETFLRLAGNKALLLPSIRPLGDVDDDEAFFAARPNEIGPAELGADLPPAAGALERRLMMAELVLAWCREKRAAAGSDGSVFPEPTPSQATHLASELLGLLDSVETERADLGRLKDLAPERFAAHWQQTVEFLQIITEHWPRILAERGVMSPYARRDALMAAEAMRLEDSRPETPIIAAGSTGSVPATAELLRVIAHLPAGCVVLPGLDMTLDAESWDALRDDNPEHPQHGMARLIAQLGGTRADVEPLPGVTVGDRDRTRLHLISEAMRPASTTDKWDAAIAEITPGALRGLDIIEAGSAEEEAEIVALHLRQAADSQSETAALVTPDRHLARRVASRLAKWGLEVEDSAGTPLARTPPGVFLNLIAEVLQQNFAPAALLGLLKHPLARLGRDAATIRQAARLLELIAFRQPQLAMGLDGIRAAYDRRRARAEAGEAGHAAIRRLQPADWATVSDLIDDLEAAFEPWRAIEAAGGDQTLRHLFKAHIVIAEALAADETGESHPLWRGDAGDVLAAQAAELLSSDVEGPHVAPHDYADIFRAMMQGPPVRPRRPTHPRLFIWGPLEARLQQADLVIVAGLNEGTWPRAADPDPWLSSPMRAAIGLSPPDRRVGLAAHDVAQLMAAKRIVLTRAGKVDGVPSVPSRWLLRLQTLLAGAGLQSETAPDLPWRAWARRRDHVDIYRPVARPEPRPPLAARPRRISVSRVEEWIANPYAIYARDILHLAPLEPLAGEPDAALRGQIIHDVLRRFTTAHPERLPRDIAAALLGLAGQLFAEEGAHPRIKSIWLPQFARFALWFEKTEPARRTGIVRSLAETRGSHVFECPGGPFTLSARADRIDITEAGALIFYDYKTGAPPKAKQVARLTSPQLPLEAAIAETGGFEGLGATEVSDLRYIRVLGVREAGEESSVAAADGGSLWHEALVQLRGLAARFDDPATPYSALRRPGFEGRYRYDDYAQLARVEEWSRASDGEG